MDVNKILKKASFKTDLFLLKGGKQWKKNRIRGIQGDSG